MSIVVSICSYVLQRIVTKSHASRGGGQVDGTQAVVAPGIRTAWGCMLSPIDLYFL